MTDHRSRTRSENASTRSTLYRPHPDPYPQYSAHHTYVPYVHSTARYYSAPLGSLIYSRNRSPGGAYNDSLCGAPSFVHIPLPGMRPISSPPPGQYESRPVHTALYDSSRMAPPSQYVVPVGQYMEPAPPSQFYSGPVTPMPQAQLQICSSNMSPSRIYY